MRGKPIREHLYQNIPVLFAKDKSQYRDKTPLFIELQLSDHWLRLIGKDDFSSRHETRPNGPELSQLPL